VPKRSERSTPIDEKPALAVLTVRERKKPITNWAALLFHVGWTSVATLMFMAGLNTFRQQGELSSSIFLLVFTTISATFVVIGARSLLRECLTFRYRHMLKTSLEPGEAKIIERKIQADDQQDSGDHKLIVQFDPRAAAGNPSPLTLSAEVSKAVYEQCVATNTVSINYCREDPQIVLIKGEPFFEHSGVTFTLGGFSGPDL